MPAQTVFAQQATGSALAADPNPYTLGMQFSVSQPAPLAAVWFYSAPGAAILPQEIALYAVTGQALVHAETVAWSGAAGSGWVRAPFAAPPALAAATSYKGAAIQTTAANWYSATAHYWDTGPGGSGLASGIITAPSNAGGDGGQDTLFSGGAGYPATSFNAANYWVDVEVTAPGLAAAFPGPPSMEESPMKKLRLLW